MESLKYYACQQELKSPLPHTQGIIMGTPLIFFKATEVIFDINSMKYEEKKPKSNLGSQIP